MPQNSAPVGSAALVPCTPAAGAQNRLVIRPLILLLCMLTLTGCSQPAFEHTVVRSGTPAELNAFRTELAQRFGAAQIAAFETALNELQLAGMERHPTAEARAAEMRELVNGQSVRAVEILGWQKRQVRLCGEIEQLSLTLEADLRTRERMGHETSITVQNRIQNVQEIVAKLRANLALTEQQLAQWTESAH
jgi:hypothetical protein